MSSITIEELQTEVPDAVHGVVYELRLRVLIAVGIDAELFVVSSEDDRYSHPASFDDLTRYPKNKAQANEEGIGFYRVKAVVLRFTEKSAAASASVAIRATLQETNRVWGRTAGIEFGGVASYVYDSGDV